MGAGLNNNLTGTMVNAPYKLVMSGTSRYDAYPTAESALRAASNSSGRPMEITARVNGVETVICRISPQGEVTFTNSWRP